MAGVALLLPGVTVGVITVALPEAESIMIEKQEATNPLDAFPGVEMRHDEAKGAAMVGGERCAILGS